MKNLKAKVEKNTERGVPKRVYDIESTNKKGDPQAIAEATIKKIAPDLKINPDLSQLKFDQVKESILGKHVLFQQYHGDKSISGAWIRVDIDNNGKVYNIQNDLIPDNFIQKTEAVQSKKSSSAAAEQISVTAAKKIALKASKVNESAMKNVLVTELAYYPQDNVPTLAWKVVTKIEKPAAEWKFYIDAVSGKILKKVDLMKCAKAMGRVFDPNPVVKLNNTKLKDNSTIPDEAYTEVALNGLAKTGKLDGPFVTTRSTKKRVTKKNGQFLFKREDRAFKEVMVYFHIDRVQRYIQELGFTNVLNQPIEVNIDGQKDDNSHYSPSSKSLTFGTGGVDDAEDAEIILHEYGHAIQDNQLPGFGQSTEAQAMGEGFGDYLAASFFEEIKAAQFKPTVGNWDAVAYDSTGKPPCLRRLDSKKKYPKDLTNDEHDNGEIWSACLWKIRAALGSRLTDKIVIAHHFLLTPQSSFADAANALILTDKNLNKGANGKLIKKIFVERGILKT